MLMLLQAARALGAAGGGCVSMRMRVLATGTPMHAHTHTHAPGVRFGEPAALGQGAVVGRRVQREHGAQAAQGNLRNMTGVRVNMAVRNRCRLGTGFEMLGHTSSRRCEVGFGNGKADCIQAVLEHSGASHPHTQLSCAQ